MHPMTRSDKNGKKMKHSPLDKDNYSFKISDKHTAHDVLRCPVCDEPYTHLESVGTDFLSKDDRLCGRLNFSCENGHKFTVRAQQHKGLTYFEVDDVIHQNWDGTRWIDPPR